VEIFPLVFVLGEYFANSGKQCSVVPLAPVTIGLIVAVEGNIVYGGQYYLRLSYMLAVSVQLPTTTMNLSRLK